MAAAQDKGTSVTDMKQIKTELISQAALKILKDKTFKKMIKRDIKQQ